jgi:magnesium transporter
MTVPHIERTMTLVCRLLEEERRDEALAVIASLLPADKAALFDALPTDVQEQLLPHVDADDVADILEELDDDDAAALAEGMDAEALVQVLDEMEPDEAADLLGDLEPQLRLQALEDMAAADQVRPLLRYPDDSAGGLMTSDYYVFRETERVGQVFRRMRAEAPRDEEIPYIYAVDAEGRLRGVARLADLIRAHPEQPLSAIADPEIITVAAEEDQETAARLLQRYDLMALPVVDAAGRLVGVISADDAMAVLEEEASEDIYLSSGIVSLYGQEAARSDLLVRGPVWQTWRVRVPFLLLTMFGGLVAGAVIGAYEKTLEAVIVLAMFIPVVMTMGGNAGAQSTEIFIRGHALGQIDTRRFMRYLVRELAIGLGMGIFMGALAGVATGVWQGMPELGLVVGLSLVCTMGLAASLGFLIPYLLVKLGADPAAGASPFITTIIDMAGVSVYFALALQLMGPLLQG